MRHTPFDGSATPFTIGLRPLDPREWIEVDERLPAYLAEKEDHFARQPEAVFRADADTHAAQQEVLDALAVHLPERFPEIYRASNGALDILPAGRRIALDRDPRRPLVTAARLVQEDLVIMRKGTDGWRLAAAALCFPSSWSLAEKFGRALPDIHATVPAFGRGSRPDLVIERIFDHLKVDQPVERLNWSLQRDDDLHHPASKRDRDRAASADGPHMAGDDPVATTFIRVERQTLRKLPMSGDILFTIRIHLDPMAVLARHPGRAALAASFARQLAGLDRDQLAYKGLTADRDRIVAALEALAAA